MVQFPLLFHSPCWLPFVPFVSPSTYLAPSSCDRNRPPQSQVACKLTLFAPPFTQPTPLPSKIPDPNCSAPYYDDLGNIPALAIWNTTVTAVKLVCTGKYERIFAEMLIKTLLGDLH